MPRFNTGDRIQLTGDIARFYQCNVGVILSTAQYSQSALTQYEVRLADGNEAIFFDFQLHTPPLMTARLIFDNSVAAEVSGAASPTPQPRRHIRFQSHNIDIQLKIDDSPDRTIMGQVVAGGKAVAYPHVTLLLQSKITNTATNGSGEFMLENVPPGDVGIEVLVPGYRVLASIRV